MKQQCISVLLIVFCMLTFNAYTQVGVDKLVIEKYADFGSTPDSRMFSLINNRTQSISSVVYEQFKCGTSGSITNIGHHSSIYGLNTYGTEYADFGQLWSSGAGLILRAGNPTTGEGVLKFQTGWTSQGASYERMRIDENGNVGVGTKTPKTKLQITNGDVYVENPDKGIILKSPNGSCWRVTIANDGNFVRTSIVCP
jgi:hypothetical protein